MSKIHKLVISSIFVSLIVPNLAFAAWWNPFTWNIFSWFHSSVKTENSEIATSTVVASTSTTKVNNTNSKTEGGINTPTINEDINNTQQNTQNISNSISQTVAQPFTVNCSPDKNSVVGTEPVTWTAQPSDGDAAHQYIWSGDDGLSGNNKSISWTYTTDGIKSANVKVINSSGQVATNICNSAVIITNSNLQAMQEQTAQDAANFANTQAQNIKQGKLDAINKQIADLNLKYANDIAQVSGEGELSSIVEGRKNMITQKYQMDYNLLVAQYQQILYSN